MKNKVKSHLLELVEKDIQDIEKIAQSTREYANSESVKSDGKYDTRGVEAGYLAGAQLKRIEELKLEKKLIEEIPTDQKNQTEIAIGSLVILEHNNEIKKYFLSTTGGGKMIRLDDEVILVISVFSPLGSELVGMQAKERFEVELPSGTRKYTVKSFS